MCTLRFCILCLCALFCMLTLLKSLRVNYLLSLTYLYLACKKVLDFSINSSCNLCSSKTLNNYYTINLKSQKEFNFLLRN